LHYGIDFALSFTQIMTDNFHVWKYPRTYSWNI